MDDFGTRMARRPRRTPAPRPARRAPRDLDMSDVLRDADEMRDATEQDALFSTPAAEVTWKESVATGGWFTYDIPGVKITHLPKRRRTIFEPTRYIVETLDDDHLPILGSAKTFFSFDAALDSLKES